MGGLPAGVLTWELVSTGLYAFDQNTDTNLGRKEKNLLTVDQNVFPTTDCITLYIFLIHGTFNMTSPTDNTLPESHVTADPGICGFPCRIVARKQAGRMVSIEISGCECDKIQKMAALLTELSLRDIFLPMTRNPVYLMAEKSGCHPSCTIPAGVLKAAEVAMELALPKDVCIQFLKDGIEKGCHDAE